MIQIDGLNKAQRAMADILWAMNGREEVESFIHSLKGNSKKNAQLVLSMMLWAIFDEIEAVDEAEAELDRIMRL